MNIHDLIEQAGVTQRQVRYLISEGFMPPPTGGRANADYGDAHVAAIRRYQRLRDAGFPPAAIKVMLSGQEPFRVPVVPGLTLDIDPTAFDGASDPDDVGARVAEILKDLTPSTKVPNAGKSPVDLETADVAGSAGAEQEN